MASFNNAHSVLRCGCVSARMFIALHFWHSPRARVGIGMSKTILVTGAAGDIGRALCARFLADRNRVVM
ncbi:MAG: hypothetical protein K0S56_3487, partial [Microvirga sp.]|nr:hypothetical protein [Microvirga sp.]